MSLAQTKKANRQGVKTIDLVARPPARQLRLAGQIYEQILQQIVSGRISEGAKLPSEKELCEMFEVSRPIVREAIEQALEGLASLLNTSADGREVDSRFHYAIAAASGNNLFVSIQDSLHDRITQGSEVAQKISGKDNHARLERIYQEHKNIFDAIMAGDGEAARTAMRTHIENARDRMFGAPNPG